MEMVHRAGDQRVHRRCAPGSYPFGGLLIRVVGHRLNDQEQKGAWPWRKEVARPGCTTTGSPEGRRIGSPMATMGQGGERVVDEAIFGVGEVR
jgi:hypothetical protein